LTAPVYPSHTPPAPKGLTPRERRHVHSIGVLASAALEATAIVQMLLGFTVEVTAVVAIVGVWVLLAGDSIARR